MYIDPSVGGVIFQVLAGLFITVSGLILVFYSRIKMGFNVLRRRFRSKSEYDTPAGSEYETESAQEE